VAEAFLHCLRGDSPLKQVSGVRVAQPLERHEGDFILPEMSLAPSDELGPASSDVVWAAQFIVVCAENERVGSNKTCAEQRPPFSMFPQTLDKLPRKAYLAVVVGFCWFDGLRVCGVSSLET